MNEHNVQDKFQEIMRKNGWLTVPINDGFTDGLPDNYLCKNGKTIWVELKHCKNKPGDLIHLNDDKSSSRGFTPLQRQWLFKFKKYGGIDAWGVIYLEHNKKFIMLPPKVLLDSFTYEELLKFPDFMEVYL